MNYENLRGLGLAVSVFRVLLSFSAVVEVGFTFVSRPDGHFSPGH